MNTLTREQLAELAADQGDVRISIFMPTRPFGPGSQEEDTTRLKNQLRTAEELLAARGLRQADIDSLLAEARALMDARPFWLRSRFGLAILIGGSAMRTLQTTRPLPEQVVVDTRFQLRPLLPSVGMSRGYWLLALSQKQVRLYAGSMDELDEVPVEGMPASLAEVVQWDDFEKASLQFHTGTSSSGGRRPAVFHGTGEVDPKDQIIRYFRDIDRGLREHLRDDASPLVIAGVDYLIPLYREINTHSHLAEGFVAGSPESFTKTTLHEQANAIAHSIWDAELEHLNTRILEAWASPTTRSDAQSILAAAFEGRIETLIVSLEAHWWGTFDVAKEHAVLHEVRSEGDEDLIELAIVQALRTGAEVTALAAEAMPHESKAVALLRY